MCSFILLLLACHPGFGRSDGLFRPRRLRRRAGPFFHQGGVDPDEVSLAAYWLAYVYRVHPTAFLDLTVDELSGHVAETQRMLKIVNKR